jgi:cytoskeleton protein RodZ
VTAAEGAKEFGEELRRERELREVSREQLAAATKVSLRQIEALETGRLDHLPACVFSRGFVRSISVYLGLDADRVVAGFRNVYENWEAESQKKDQTPTTSANPRLSRPRRAVSSDTTVRGLVIAALLALLTGGAAFLKSRAADSRKSASASTTPVSRSLAGPASLALPPAIAAATVALPADGPGPRHASGSPASASESVSTLTLSFKEDCWAEVLVDGKVAVRGLFQKGTKREFRSGGTFTLTLGNAGVVELAVDGHALEPIGGEGQVVKNYVIDRGSVARNG